MEFSDLCKELYVEAAEDKCGIEGRASNMSRIALMTGINRHEAKRLRQKNSQTDDPKALHSYYKIAEILAKWHEDARYLDDNDKPLDITLEGAPPSFTTLVQPMSTGGDVAVITILKELKRSQAIEEVGEGSCQYWLVITYPITM